MEQARKVVGVATALIVLLFVSAGLAAPPREALSPSWAMHHSLGHQSSNATGGSYRIGVALDSRAAGGKVQRLRKAGDAAPLPLRAEIERAVFAPIPEKTARVIVDSERSEMHIRIGNVVRSVHYEIRGGGPVADALLASASRPCVESIRQWNVVDDVIVDSTTGTVLVRSGSHEFTEKLSDLAPAEVKKITETFFKVEFPLA